MPDNAATPHPSSTPTPPAAAIDAAARHIKLLSAIMVALGSVRACRASLREQIPVAADFGEEEETARDEIGEAALHLTDAIEHLESAHRRSVSLVFGKAAPRG